MCTTFKPTIGEAFESIGFIADTAQFVYEYRTYAVITYAGWDFKPVEIFSTAPVEYNGEWATYTATLVPCKTCQGEYPLEFAHREAMGIIESYSDSAFRGQIYSAVISGDFDLSARG